MATQPLKILKINKIYLICGIILVILGFIFLKYTPMEKSWENQVFAWNKMVLAPITLVLGYVLIGISIFKPSKK